MKFGIPNLFLVTTEQTEYKRSKNNYGGGDRIEFNSKIILWQSTKILLKIAKILLATLIKNVNLNNNKFSLLPIH